jgi:hypothetical protein
MHMLINMLDMKLELKRFYFRNASAMIEMLLTVD